MLVIQRLCLALVLALCTTAAVRAQGGIPWISDLSQARARAVRENRLILLHFYSDSCPPCRMLDQQVYPDPQVAGAIGRDYVPVKINSSRAPDLVRHYGIRTVPTDIVLDRQGRVVVQTSSPRDAAGYVRMLTELAAARHAAVDASPASDHAAGHGYPADSQAAAFAATAPANPPAATANGLRADGAGAAESASRYRWDPTARTTASTYGSPPQESLASRTPPAAHGSATPQSLSAEPRYADQYRPEEMPAERAMPGPQPPGSETPGGRRPPQTASASGYGRYAPSQAGMQAPREEHAAFRNPRAADTWGSADVPGRGQPATVPNPGFASYAPPRTAPGTAPGGSAAAGQPAGAGTADVQAADPPRIALEGFCPVTLADQEKWQAGDRRFGVVHRGRTYLFASAEHQKRFLADPDRFSPVLSGYDPVAYIERGELVDGRRQHGVWYRTKTYLFADEASLRRFESAAEYYAEKCQEAMQGRRGR